LGEGGKTTPKGPRKQKNQMTDLGYGGGRKKRPVTPQKKHRAH